MSEGFDRLDKCRASDGAPDTFRAARPIMHCLIPLAPRQQGGHVGEPSIDGSGCRGAVVAARKMRMRAGPGPVPRVLDQPGPHGIEQDIAHGRRQMRLIHRHSAETALPEVAGTFQLKGEDSANHTTAPSATPEPDNLGRICKIVLTPCESPLTLSPPSRPRFGNSRRGR